MAFSGISTDALNPPTGLYSSVINIPNKWYVLTEKGFCTPDTLLGKRIAAVDPLTGEIKFEVPVLSELGTVDQTIDTLVGRDVTGKVVFKTLQGQKILGYDTSFVECSTETDLVGKQLVQSVIPTGLMRPYAKLFKKMSDIDDDDFTCIDEKVNGLGWLNISEYNVEFFKSAVSQLYSWLAPPPVATDPQIYFTGIEKLFYGKVMAILALGNKNIKTPDKFYTDVLPGKDDYNKFQIETVNKTDDKIPVSLLDLTNVTMNNESETDALSVITSSTGYVVVVAPVTYTVDNITRQSAVIQIFGEYP